MERKKIEERIQKLRNHYNKTIQTLTDQYVSEMADLLNQMEETK